MQTKIIATTGEIELEQQINSFVIGKNIVDIKLTEWVSYQHQTGGYSALVMFEEGPPTRQVQVKIFAATNEVDIEQQINQFIFGRSVVDIKFTEWAEYEAQTGGYTALAIFINQPNAAYRQQTSQPTRPQQNGRSQQFNTI